MKHTWSDVCDICGMDHIIMCIKKRVLYIIPDSRVDELEACEMAFSTKKQAKEFIDDFLK